MVKKKSHSFYDGNDVISLQEEEDDEDLFSLYQRAHQMQGMSLHDDYSTCTLPSSVSASPTIDISEEEEDDEEGDMMIIPQNLSLEEQNYQFPMIQYDQEQIGTDPFIVTQKHHQDIVFTRNETAFSFYSSMSSEIDPSTSFRTNESHKLIIKIDKTRRQCTVIYNEGYIEDDERFELESECTFYPVNKQQAASKIQSLWRAHHKKDDILQLLLLCGRFHQYKILKFQQKLDSLEAKIEEEQAMRVAFETAMEDLTEVIDQQQKMLYDRLDQQVHMGRSCESKMKVLAKSLNPLELRLQQETEARKELEVTMGRVLEELEDTKQSIIQSTKQQQQTSSSPKRRNMRSAVPEKRTSVIPSIRRPISNKQQAPARRNANGLKQQS